MDYLSLREKHGERILNLTATDIVLAGMKALQGSGDKSPLAAAINACMVDINSGSWDEIRAAIKRSL